MTQYNTLNVKLSQLNNKLEREMKNGNEITLNLPSNLIENSNDETILHIDYYQLIHKFQNS